MSGRFQSYDSYKASGVERIGEIPLHWKTIPLKGRCRIVNGSTPKSDVDAYWGGAIAWVTPADLSKLHTPYVEEGERSISDAGYQSCGTQLVPSGSVVLSSRAPIGTVAIAVKQICTNQGCKSLVVRADLVSKFLYYVLSISSGPLNVLGRGTTFLELSSGELGRFQFACPEKDEQTQIAKFLDYETLRIDALIEKQQQLIALLKEKRQAVISHAVTKGLNPDAPMRDSGVEWLGEVPAHWKVGALSYALNAVGDVDHYMPPSVEKGVPYVMTGDLKELASEIDFSRCKQVTRHDYLRLCKKIKTTKGDIIMARYATIGTVSYVDLDSEFLVSYSCVTIKPNVEKVLGRYLFFCLKSDSFSSGIQERINTNTQGNVGIADLRKLKVALPPIEEQQRIAEHLQVRVAEMGKVLESSEAAIGLLQERRTALISAAVTGKIDVRSWKAPESEAEAEVA